MTQCDRVMRHLINIGPLSGAEAMFEYGIQHLASRISDLRRDGVKILDKMATGKNRYGEKVAWKVYYLPDEEILRWKSLNLSNYAVEECTPTYGSDSQLRSLA